MAFATVMDQKLLKGMLPGRHYDDPKRRGLQDVPRETPLIDETTERGPDIFENGSMFPRETVLYKADARDYSVSHLYDKSLKIQPPFFYLAIRFDTNENSAESGIIPIVLHRGNDRTGAIYGHVEGIERHTVGTINHHAFNPSATFPTTKVPIDAYLTKEYCNFSYSAASLEDPRVQITHNFQWRQCTAAPEVLDLCRSRPEGLETHDWCWIDRKNERGYKLFYMNPNPNASQNPVQGLEEPKKKKSIFGRAKDKALVRKEDSGVGGKCLAVFVAAKTHSKMNPMKIAGRLRWMDEVWNEGPPNGGQKWGDEGRIAAFLALMGYLEKSRRVGTSGGSM